MIKFQSVLSFICMITLFFSCSNSPDGNSDGLLEGKWNLTYLEFKGDITSYDIEFDLTIEQSLEAKGKEFDFCTTYNPDGTFFSTGRYVYDITTSIDGESATEEVVIDESGIEGEYSFDGTTLTVIDPTGEESLATVTRLTDSELIIKSTILENDTIAGIAIMSDVEYEYRFVR